MSDTSLNQIARSTELKHTFLGITNETLASPEAAAPRTGKQSKREMKRPSDSP